MSEYNTLDVLGRFARLKLCLSTLLIFTVFIGNCQTLTPEFVDAGYSILDVGSVPGVPTNYGGLTIRPEEPNTLYIGGAANNSNGALYSIALIRDGETDQVTGFSGTATLVVATPDIDGGVTYAPNGTLLFTQYSQNGLGQILTDDTYITTDLTPYGIASSVGSLVLVPPGYSGAGNFIIASYSGNYLYNVPYTISEAGEYLISNQTAEVPLDGTADGPEGIAYIPLGSDGFPNPSMVISSYGDGKVVAFDIDATGFPIVSTARDMITDLTGAEGALIDPVTGDFLFSTYGGGNHVIVMSGFESPDDCAGVPFGESILDECGICRLPDDPDFNSTCTDCAGVVNGTAFLDDCGDCVGGLTGEEPCVFDCPDLEANIGDDCDDGDESTENDMVNDTCDCVGVSIWDCPDLEANIGDDCDDGNESTENDVLNEDCDCFGTPIAMATLLELECGGEVIQISSAIAGPTLGGEAVSDTRTVYAYEPDGDGDSPTYVGAAWPYVMINGSINVDGSISAALTVNDDGVLLVNGSPAYQYVGDPSPDDANGTFGPWSYYLLDGTPSQDACPPVWDCPELEANVGDDCDDGDESTENDEVDSDCECSGTPILVWDCPDLEANIGDDCDDGNADTENDMVNASCACEGIPIIVWDCTALEANIGDACDDGDAGTENDMVNDNCICEGTPIIVWDCTALEANIGDACDDGDESTENDEVDSDCECSGTPILVWDCPDLEADVGDECDDNDDTTENDSVDGDCICSGTPMVVWDCPELEADFGDDCDDEDESTENDEVGTDCICTGTPIIVWDCTALEANIGDACDDGDAGTENDMVNDNCICEGTPIIIWDCPDLEANIGDECDDGNDDLIPGIVNEDCACEPQFDCPAIGANIGDACDDGDDMTENDMVNANCGCSGTPIITNPCDNWVMYINDNEGGESDIYAIDISSGDAVLAYITTVEFHAHMAYNSDEHQLYVVNNTTGDYVIVDPASGVTTGPFVLSDEIPSITTAVFAPNGKLLVGSATEDIIYSIDVSDNSVSVFDGYAPVSGGDIAFDSEGMLYLATRSGNGLYEVYPDDVWDDQYIGSVPSLVTGMALTESEQLLTSHNGNADLHLYNLDGSAAGTTYPLMLDEEPFMHHNGDLASGCQEPDDLSVGDCEIFSTFYADINRPGFSGTDLYGVGFTDGGNAIMTFLTNVPFDTHIAYNAQEDVIYLVNQNGSFIRGYDPSLGIFIGDIPIIGGYSGSVAVVYNPEDGLLYVGADSDDVYSIDPGTGVATYLFDAPVSGGDFALQDGKLYLATRAGAKLYEIVGGVPVEVGSIPALVNGMAQANNSTDLIIANKNAGVFTKILAVDGSTIGTYIPMIDGDAVTLYDGDMAAGCGDDEPLIIGECYATEIMEYVEGTNSGGGAISADRTDSSQALDEPERTDELVFVSLGYGGSLTVGFGGIVPNGPGDDIEVVETSYNNPGCESYPEYADVYVSLDGVDWHMAGNVCKGDPFVDISDAGDFDHIMYVMVVNTDGTTTSSDGFDVDGIVALHNCEEDGGEEGGDELVIVTESINTLTSFPNPTAGHSQVVFATSATERTLVEVYDMNGRNVETLFNQVAQQGQEYRIDFDGTDLPNGVYVYRMTTNNETIIDKFMIAR